MKEAFPEKAVATVEEARVSLYNICAFRHLCLHPGSTNPKQCLPESISLPMTQHEFQTLKLAAYVQALHN